jgi:hypothetical protein
MAQENSYITVNRRDLTKVLSALEWNKPLVEDFGDKQQLDIYRGAIEIMYSMLITFSENPSKE